MAHCHSCDQEISYLAAVRGTFKYWRVNFRRRMMLVFDCPHCDTPCQETALSTYGFVIAFVALLVGISTLVEPAPFRFGAMTLVAFAVAYVPARHLWWKVVARVKEPHVFWFER